MSHFIRATVTERTTDSLTLKLDDGQTLKWPLQTAEDSHLNIDEISVGTELTLTLTHTQHVINELLGNSNNTNG